jgi:hypothetical protein
MSQITIIEKDVNNTNYSYNFSNEAKPCIENSAEANSKTHFVLQGKEKITINNVTIRNGEQYGTLTVDILEFREGRLLVELDLFLPGEIYWKSEHLKFQGELNEDFTYSIYITTNALSESWYFHVYEWGRPGMRRELAGWAFR